VTYILTGDYSDINNWQQIAVENAPVSSVNGQVGTVNLTNADVGAASDSHDNTAHSETYTTTAENVENFATSGADGTVPTSQGDGTLAMEGISGGLWTEDANSPLISSGSQSHTISLNSSWSLILCVIDTFKNTSGNTQQIGVQVNGITTSDYEAIKEDGTIFGTAESWYLFGGDSITDGFGASGPLILDTGPTGYASMRNNTTSGFLSAMITQGRVSAFTAPIDSITFHGQSGETSVEARVYGWSE